MRRDGLDSDTGIWCVSMLVICLLAGAAPPATAEEGGGEEFSWGFQAFSFLHERAYGGEAASYREGQTWFG